MTSMAPSLGHRLRVAAALALLGLLASAHASEGGGVPRDPRAALADALRRQDLEAVHAAVAAGRAALGDRAGEPETADEYRPIRKDARTLTPEEARAAFGARLPELSRLVTWRVGMDPTTMRVPLRAPASVVAGCVAACRAKLDGSETALALARESAAFLLSAQAQAETGGFPFPAVRGATSDAAFRAADRFLARAEAEGRLGEVVRNGWAFDDALDGGLQYDNGECGEALFDLAELTHDPGYLASACRSADWAARRPVVPNWNYNAFGVALLARAFAATGEKAYLEAAKARARLGVMPGQLPDGPRAGRWLDPHNARPAYHYILLRALARLAAVLTKDDADRPAVVAALRLGLRARNADFVERGAPNKDSAMEALLLVTRAFSDDASFLAETRSTEALDALSRLVSEEARRGGAPLGPRAWGLFLERAAGAPTAPAKAR